MSQLIEILRYPLIVGVVFIHSFPVSVKWKGEYLGTQDPGTVSLIIRNLFSEGMFRLPVPMLFLFAGFLFFWNVQQNEFQMSVYVQKWKSRARSLVIPFLFWNVAVLLFIAIAQASFLAPYFFESYPIREYGPFNFLNAVLGITHAPIAYQFWFIRNLIVLVALSPVIYALVRWAGIFYLLPLGSLWLMHEWPLRIPDAPGLFFFSLGAYLGLKKWDRWTFDSWRIPLSVAYLSVLIWDVSTKGMQGNGKIHHLGILIGIPCLLSWMGLLLKHQRIAALLKGLAPASFFLFAAHEPLLMMLRKTLYWTLEPQSDAIMIGLYFLYPSLVIILCTGAFYALRSRFPNAMGWITGGR
jgi:surface polysaccharide O-acyltransferase-like enzyme